jgi:hypothetical protein
MLVALALGGCFRDRTVDESGEISEAEQAAFTAPADSSLTDAQVDRYLRTMLAQIELVQAEAPAAAREMTSAAAPMDTLTGKPMTRMARWSRFLEATHVRAARRAESNPAEMDFVAARLRAVGGYLSARQAQSGSAQAAAMFRDQAESMKGRPGVTQAQIDQLLQAAAQAEQQTPQAAPPRVQHNLQTLRSARPGITDAMWIQLASASGGEGLMTLGDLGDTTNVATTQRLSQLRDLYERAIENAAEPGT